MLSWSLIEINYINLCDILFYQLCLWEMGNGYINYQEYLDSEAWRGLKKLKLEEQPNCEICWNPADTVHHLSYERRWAEKSDDIRSLCTSCHNKCHFDNAGDKVKLDENSLIERFNEIIKWPYQDRDLLIFALWWNIQKVRKMFSSRNKFTMDGLVDALDISSKWYNSSKYMRHEDMTIFFLENRWLKLVDVVSPDKFNILSKMLMFATTRWDLQMVKEILKKWTKINDYGWISALIEASKRWNKEIIRALLTSWVTVNDNRDWSSSALYSAKNREIRKMLLEYWASKSERMPIVWNKDTREIIWAIFLVILPIFLVIFSIYKVITSKG